LELGREARDHHADQGVNGSVDRVQHPTKEDPRHDVRNGPRDEGHQPEKRLTGERLIQRERQAEPQDKMANQAPGHEGEGVLEGLQEDRVVEGLLVLTERDVPAGAAVGGEARLQGDEGGKDQHRRQQQGGRKDEKVPKVAIMPGAAGTHSDLPQADNEPGGGFFPLARPESTGEDGY
jgi:hypothetical protein